MAETKKQVYDESKIKTLSSIEHIRLRTGMYIGRIGDGSHYDDGCYILLKEVIDNGIDEFIMGFGKEVKILVNKYQGLRFVDTLFHESGHALHYSFDFEPEASGSPKPSFVLEANFAEPFDEGMGQVMALMIYRPQGILGDRREMMLGDR